MRIRIVMGLFFLGMLFAISILWSLDSSFAVNAATSSELHVCPSGCVYSSVQAAVDAANDGDVIKVASGTYTGVSTREGVTQVAYVDKSVTIQGGYTTTNWTKSDPMTNITTLDAQGQGRVLFVVGGNGAVIDGFHITGGNAIGQMGGNLPSDVNGSSGGGVYVHGSVDPFGAEFTLTNNQITGNTAKQGGGVYMSFCCSSATLRGNTFTSNVAENDGGGVLLHAGNAGLIKNIFDSNAADRGGGLWVDCSGSDLSGNSFLSNTAHTAGGGLFLDMACSNSRLDKTIIRSNNADRGGGIAITGGALNDQGRKAALMNTVIADNQASEEGSGVYVVSANTVQLSHVTLANNSGGDGSGLCVGEFAFMDSGPSTVTLINTILVSQTIGLVVTNDSTATVNSILWHSTPVTISQSAGAVVSVQNQYTGSPAFVDPDGGDYHIKPDSAAIDKGVVTSVSTDLDNEPRLGFPDLGADEYWAPGTLKRIFLPLVVRH